MKKTIHFSLVAFLILLGCSKVDDVSVVNSSENQLKSAQSSINKDKQDRQILFISKRDAITTDEIYSMNADGSNIVRLTNNEVPDGRASWSANGQHITFASGVVGSRDIFVMNANGQGLRNKNI